MFLNVETSGRHRMKYAIRQTTEPKKTQLLSASPLSAVHPHLIHPHQNSSQRYSDIRNWAMTMM